MVDFIGTVGGGQQRGGDLPGRAGVKDGHESAVNIGRFADETHDDWAD